MGDEFAKLYDLWYNMYSKKKGDIIMNEKIKK